MNNSVQSNPEEQEEQGNCNFTNCLKLINFKVKFTVFKEMKNVCILIGINSYFIIVD